MHGLIYRTLQTFVQDSYGPARWLEVGKRVGLETPDFEAMLFYDPGLYDALLRATEGVLGVPQDMLLEDVGTYLVSHPNCEVSRRLLRFGGVDFVEFLYSLEDLSERARLAVADLHLPDLELRDHTQNAFVLRSTGDLPGFGHVMIGVLRAMADDYGALVLLDYQRCTGRVESVEISLVETRFAAGRDFTLGQGPVDGAREAG